MTPVPPSSALKVACTKWSMQWKPSEMLDQQLASWQKMVLSLQQRRGLRRRSVFFTVTVASGWCSSGHKLWLSSQLLDTGAVGVRREKMYKLDGHVACAVAGITGVHTIMLDRVQGSKQASLDCVSCTVQLMPISSSTPAASLLSDTRLHTRSLYL